jgi:hypothetical protein
MRCAEGAGLEEHHQLAADASAADGLVRGGMEGSERRVTVVFIDLRGSTTLGEARMPYDVLFILNQFFNEMTTVTWINGDDIPHTVTSSGKVFKSKTLDTEDKFSFTFTTPGSYEYFCSLHPHMTGAIVVEAATGSNATQ